MKKDYLSKTTDANDWEIEFDKIEYDGVGGFDKIKSFIHSLLDKQKQEFSKLMADCFSELQEEKKESLMRQKQELIEEIKSEMASKWADTYEIMPADVYDILDKFKDEKI